MNSSLRVLVVEDTASLALTFAGQLEAAGCEVDVVGDGTEARRRVEHAHQPYDVVLLDLKLPDCDGLQLLEMAPEFVEQSSVVVITADGSINRAIQAMRLGAYDFLVKPVAPERLTTTVSRAGERRVLEREVSAARRMNRRERFHGFVGASDAMQAVYRAIENVANSKATVFVTGESGTGKEVTAEALHSASRRRDRAFVAINCGAIPENLLESELFGHVKGAFTGAVENRIGAAKAADGGTLFLDEICEMELKLQVKLLRFIQTGMIQRVGSAKAEPVDVRIVCATNRDPLREVAEGRFREDLYYRLNVIPIHLPPLRERGDDILMLADYFLRRIAEEEQRSPFDLDSTTRAAILTHPWPGNVRELQNVLRRAAITSSDSTLEIHDLATRPLASRPDALAEPSPRPAAGVAVPADPVSAPLSETQLAGMTLAQIERIAIEGALARHAGNVTRAAKELEVNPSTIYRKMERWQQP